MNCSLLQKGSEMKHGSSKEENTFDIFNSEQDETYSEKEDLIQNKKWYKKDKHPWGRSIPKTEVQGLLHD